jgi:signal transduction histidine kinase
LHEADIVKEEFSAMVTHELKTPLVPIIGYSELLLDGTLGSLTEKQTETVRVISTSASSLMRLISDLLDARKLELGKMKIEKREVSAKEIVEHCVTGFKPLAQARGINLTAKVEQEQPNDRLMLTCDGKRIRQVLDNLVNNAIKFSPANVGKIEVSVKKEEVRGNMLFSVKDNGTGIPKEKQRNIFQKFYQADTSMTRNAGGTGLGLAISKGIIEAHDGTIWFESEPGVGTTFYFLIPRSLKPATFRTDNGLNSQESLST